MQGTTGIIQEPSLLNSWTAYPSPSSGTLNIAYSLAQNASVEIKLFSLEGKELVPLQTKQTQEAGSHEIHADLSTLEQGSYFIQILSNGLPETKRFLIIR